MIIGGLGGAGFGQEYEVYHTSALSTPYQVTENYHSVVFADTTLGVVDVNLPLNPAGEKRMVTVVNTGSINTGFNPVNVLWNAVPVAIPILLPALSVTYTYDTVLSKWAETANFLPLFSILTSILSLIAQGVAVNLAGSFALFQLTPPSSHFLMTGIQVTKGIGKPWTGAPSISIGFNAPNYNNLLANTNLTTAANMGMSRFQPNVYLIPSGTMLYMKVNTPGVVTGGTARVDIHFTGRNIDPTQL